MALVFEETLKKNIAADVSGIYLLFGEDSFLKKNYAEKIGKKIADTDDIFNYCKFSGDCDLQDVYDAAMQIPLMSDKKYIELCDYDFEHCSKADFDKLCDLVSESPDTAVLVIRFDSIEIDSKKSTKFKKLASAIEKVGGLVVNLDHRKMPELIKMLVDGAAKRGIKMEPSAAKYLIETAGDDINTLKNELIKLCAFSKGDIITKETVDMVSVKTVEASVYNLSRFILNTDTSAALSCLDELFFMRIEPMIILHTVSSVYVDMFRIYSAKEQGLGIKDVATQFGYKGREFVLEKAAQSLRKFDFKRLNLSLKALTQADKSLKSFGADSRIVLEQLIIRLIYIITKGEAVD